MTNIWRFSLVLAFSIILDQVLKGIAQGFLDHGTTVELLPRLLFGSFSVAKVSNGVNSLLIFFTVIVSFLLLRSIVLNRNMSFMAGMARTFILSYLCSNFLDRMGNEYIVNYLSYFDMNFSLSLAMLFFGIVILFLMSFRERFA
jgi:lipoprotein signal peptidase